jgi:two-component system cell cycle sensor histidine kinase/response regulator CckA
MKGKTLSLNRSAAADPDCGRRLETLGMVAEGVAHDFNNILATISGFAELILDGRKRPERRDADAQRFARNILDAALAGQSSIRELRGFSHCQGEEAETLELHEVLRKSLAMCRGSLGGRVRVRTEFADMPALAEGCRGLLQNAFLNLFINARDAMPKGGILLVRTWVAVSGDPARPCLVVSVGDTGIGMSPEVRARLFERYFTTKGERGTGLGLAQVRETMNRHGGWITVESEPDSGTEFRLHFPLGPKANAPEGPGR